MDTSTPVLFSKSNVQSRRPALRENGNLFRSRSLFAARRIGKTYFLKNDLTPCATSEGFLTIYADLWLNRGSPLEAINHALEETLDDLTVPVGIVGKIAKTPIKGIAGIQFGDELKRRRLPDQPELRFDALVMRISISSGKRILIFLTNNISLLTSQAWINHGLLCSKNGLLMLWA